jgi:putative hydrolase of the HAD superfamily
MISAVLFDLGGTLDGEGLHWLDRFYAIYDASELAHLPKPLIKEAFYWADQQAEQDLTFRTVGMREMMDRHVAWQFQKLGIQNLGLQEALSAAFHEPASRAMTRNAAMLKTLHDQGLRLGIISNFYGNVEALCQEFGYMPYLNVILDSAVVGLRKPDLKIFERATSTLGVAAGQTLFVGDSFERDIIPAKALGMKTAWVVDSLKQPPQPSKADRIIHHLAEIPPFVAELQEAGAA